MLAFPHSRKKRRSRWKSRKQELGSEREGQVSAEVPLAEAGQVAPLSDGRSFCQHAGAREDDAPGPPARCRYSSGALSAEARHA
ncbi:unnamed protein product, partial [Prorocentrum cordatum]